MDTWDNYFVLLLLSLSVIPFGLLMIGIYFFSTDTLAILGVVFTPIIPIWIISIHRMQEAQNTIYDMNIKKEMQDDLKRLGIK